jgi:hypothetical protein
MSDRQGVEIDYCPQCRGVWLDRGELDKIIERSAGDTMPAARASAPPPQRDERYERESYRPKYDDDDHKYEHQKRKKGSFLGDLFDF